MESFPTALVILWMNDMFILLLLLLLLRQVRVHRLGCQLEIVLGVTWLTNFCCTSAILHTHKHAVTSKLGQTVPPCNNPLRVGCIKVPFRMSGLVSCLV